MNILQACRDPNLFAPWFKNSKSWEAWEAALAAIFGLPMREGSLALYCRHTGRKTAPACPTKEAWLIVGRRGGKSFNMALIGVFLACFRDYRKFLQPGERATVAVIAADRRQARVILRYVRGLLTNVPMLTRMIVRETAEGFDLNNMVTIEVHSASFRATRGYTFAAVLVDEIAFLRTGDDAANPDTEILAALRPGLATIPNSMLICASSPYARRGELWEAYRRYYGKENAPLIWKATTREMNPAIGQHIVDEAMERDPASAAAEYMAEFRTDIESFVSREVIDAAIVPGRHELPSSSAYRYSAFVDPSGGSHDSMTLAISHRESDRAIVDVVREWRPPFSPDGVVQEAAQLLKSYGLLSVEGDRYGGEWPRERFRTHGVTYNPADKPKSDLYREVLPLLNAGRVELIDVPRLAAQLSSLERRVGRGGKDSIDHPPGAHDDLANAVAGALVLAMKRSPRLKISKSILDWAAQPMERPTTVRLH